MIRAWLQGRYCVEVAHLVLHAVDTTALRLFVAWASGLYALLLMWPHIVNPLRPLLRAVLPDNWVSPTDAVDLFARPAYAIMSLVPGGSYTWAGLFVAHLLGVHWRILVPKTSIGWAIAINALGLVVWAYSTLSLALSLGTLLPTSAAEVVVIVVCFVITARTGLAKEIVTP